MTCVASLPPCVLREAVRWFIQAVRSHHEECPCDRDAVSAEDFLRCFSATAPDDVGIGWATVRPERDRGGHPSGAFLARVGRDVSIPLGGECDLLMPRALFATYTITAAGRSAALRMNFPVLMAALVVSGPDGAAPVAAAILDDREVTLTAGAHEWSVPERDREDS